MDHPIYLPYSAPNGVPQESKLATYMVNMSFVYESDTKYTMLFFTTPLESSKHKHPSRQ